MICLQVAGMAGQVTLSHESADDPPLAVIHGAPPISDTHPPYAMPPAAVVEGTPPADETDEAPPATAVPPPVPKELPPTVPPCGSDSARPPHAPHPTPMT